jgi:DNA replication protein DnaC
MIVDNARKTITKADMQYARVGDRFWGAKLDQVPRNGKPSVVQTYVGDVVGNVKKGWGLLLFGLHGRGKTCAGVVILKHVLLHRGSALFLGAGEIQDAAFGRRDFDSDTPLLERAAAVDLLLIDDLGIEHTREFGKGLVEGLVRERSTKNKATIVTLNLGLDDIQKRYGAGLMSVFSETVFPVSMKGPDLREKTAAKLHEHFVGSR